MSLNNPPRLAWITGAGGLIGNYLVQTAPAGWKPRGLARKDADLTDFKKVEELFNREKPALVVHCAALSRSPECQADPAAARRNNVEATARLGALAWDIPFIFFSTDLVFDGQKGGYIETDAVNPLSVYAETKAEAELAVLKNPLHAIIRTSLNGGVSPAGNRGFNEELRAQWKKGAAPRLFTDEFRSPIPAVATAQAVWRLAERYQPGIFHLAGTERLSRWDIGEALAARWPELHPRLERASLKEYNGAPRPPDTSLDCSKIKRLLDFKLPGLRGWLRDHPDEIF